MAALLMGDVILLILQCWMLLQHMPALLIQSNRWYYFINTIMLDAIATHAAHASLAKG